jgi:general nucleoside transport system permease protein
VILGIVHALLCGMKRVIDIAVGIALMLFGVGLAFYLGKGLIQPTAPRLSPIELGFWVSNPQVKSALAINPLFFVGAALAPLLAWALHATRAGMILRTVGESAEAARAMGHNVNAVRLWTTAAGGFLAGIGGSYLSLGYPGSWNEGLSSGGIGDLRQMGSSAVSVCVAAVRWRQCIGAGAAIGGRNFGILFVQRHAVCADAGHHDRHVLTTSHPGRHADGIGPGTLTCLLSPVVSEHSFHESLHRRRSVSMAVEW